MTIKRGQRHGNADSIARLIARELRSGNNLKCAAQDCHLPARSGGRYCSEHKEAETPLRSRQSNKPGREM